MDSGHASFPVQRNKQTYFPLDPNVEDQRFGTFDRILAHGSRGNVKRNNKWYPSFVTVGIGYHSIGYRGYGADQLGHHRSGYHNGGIDLDL